MQFQILFLIIFVLQSAIILSKKLIENGLIRADIKTPELIAAHGFDVETHYITTRDGYILTAYRLVNPYYKGELRPVICQHGVMQNSNDYIMNEEVIGLSPSHNRDACDIKTPVMDAGKNLGFELRRLGFDVWLCNSRGNEYSKNHTTLNPKTDKKFWEYTWDKMAEFDIPAELEYVLRITGKSTLSYIGHSEGTSTVFGLLAERPEYSEIIKPFIALAPVTSFFHTTPLLRLVANIPIVHKFLKTFKGRFFLLPAITQMAAKHICPYKKVLCETLMFAIVGFDPKGADLKRVPVYFYNFNAGTSSWNILHLVQTIQHKVMRKFDLGKETNTKLYGQPTPPVYPLERINSTQIALLYGANDFFVSLEDVHRLKERLRVPLMMDYKVPLKEWNHMDFFWHKEAGKYVNNVVVDVLVKSLKTSGKCKT